MPSQTFLNLDISKQQKLLEVAKREFCTVPYTEVSINKITQAAEISRGSFYTYFIDKNDLFSYILELNKKVLNEMTREVIVSCNGDMRESFLQLFDMLVQRIEEYQLSRFLKNIFLYFSIYKEKFERPGHDLFLYVKDVISLESLKSSDLEFVFHLFMHNLLFGITEAVKSTNIPIVREQYRGKVDILCYGIYKEEK
ncbi:MAG: TetR/AcrR family transcriptional regulator [Candidatus Faecimonas sp.]|nr:TetR/AcrR family transcriptional regulator [Mycoplasmatota bacterium]MDY2908296.1 TetR/AcrR family transcriptional regulator [Candidatus Faecimonas sp.]